MLSNNYVLELQNISIGYENTEILQSVSFGVCPGELIGIIGPNGAGKSTLLKTIEGIIPPSKGKLFLYDEDISAIKEKEFAHKISYLQQQQNIPFAYRVRDIVMTGRFCHLSWWQQEGDDDKDIVRAAMEYTGVAELADKNVNDLSGGQRQRVMLAKVLAQQTPIMLLDEPATGLDIIYQEELFGFCRELCLAGKTVIMVVHELTLAARFCSRLLLVANGTLLADGKPNEVLTEKLLSEAYGTGIKVSSNEKTGHADIYAAGIKNIDEKKQLLKVILGKEADHDQE